MRVVHIITGLRAGGAERLLFDRALRTRHDVHIVTLSTDGVFADRLRGLGVPVHSIGMATNKDVASLARLSRLLKDLAPDVVHVHLYRSLLFGRLAARLAGLTKIVATEHSATADATEGHAATRSIKAMYRAAERLGTVTVAVSSDTRDDLVAHWGIPASRVVVVPNGVDVDRLVLEPADRARVRGELGIHPGARVLVTVGRLVAEKRLDLALGALALMRERCPAGDHHLLVVGAGAGDAETRALAARLGLADRVHFTGEVEDVVAYLAAGDAYVSTSPRETYGIAVVEAYVAGLPVVYVHSPAAADLRSSFDDGRLIEVPASAEAVADGLSRALALPVGTAYVDPRVRRRVDVGDVVRRLDDLEEQVGRGVRVETSTTRGPDGEVAAGAAGTSYTLAPQGEREGS